ncbi:hypothetical protein WT59_20715 [Burkholderia territorii]|uniref:ApeA N-terminal domain 1-containing protein n=1 Tax=Burkholderia territorii TaxID=1503055 RepID=UPI000754339F|nr:HEPN domain-containing protein [Burkholderia territorii]KWH09744.1 hypothetical protein WT59_20715 [Burkholderia territorii]
MKKNYILDEQGYFWWHDEKYPNTQFAPEHHVTGWLKIADDGELRLELDGMLKDDQHPFAQFADNVSSRRSPRPIQGITKKTGKKVLLIDAVATGGQFRSNSFSFERYFATMCLVGDNAFVKNGKVPRFSQIEIDLTGFENWLRLGTLDVKRTKRVMKLQCDVVRDVVYNTEVGKLKFAKHTDVIEPNGLHRFEAKVREYMTLTFKRKSALSPEQVREEFGALQDLMTLLTNSHFSLAWPTVQVSGSKKRFTFYFRRLTSSASPPELHELCTNFFELRDSFGEIYAAWRTKREAFGPGFFSYLSTRRDVNLYVENRFSNLVQGMEFFHRTKHGAELPDTALQDKVDRILADITLAKDRKWLMRRLQHAAEPTLEQRLSAMFESLPFDIDPQRLKSFAKACADIRNDLAHFGGQRMRERSANFLQELSWKADALGFFYHVTLLKETGLTNESIKAWLMPGLATMHAREAMVQAGLMNREKVNTNRTVPRRADPPWTGSPTHCDAGIKA